MLHQYWEGMRGQQPTNWDEANVEENETNLCGKLCTSHVAEDDEEPSDGASVAARYDPLPSSSSTAESIIASSISEEIELDEMAIGSVAPAPSTVREVPPHRIEEMARCKTEGAVVGNVVVVVEDDALTGDDAFLLVESPTGCVAVEEEESVC